MTQVKAIVLRAAGINCDMETEYALHLAGAEAQRVHINRLIEDMKKQLENIKLPRSVLINNAALKELLSEAGEPQAEIILEPEAQDEIPAVEEDEEEESLDAQPDDLDGSLEVI